MKEKSTTGFVYIWFDIKRKMYYIGSHWGYVDDSYICSSTRMRNAYKRRPETFKRRIIYYLEINHRSILLKEEQRYLEMISDDEMKVKYYNKSRNATGQSCEEFSKIFKNHWADPEKRESHIKAMSKSWTPERKKAHSEKLKKKWAEGNYKDRDNSPTPEGKIRIVESSKARYNPEKLFTEETKKKMSISAKKRANTPEYKERFKLVMQKEKKKSFNLRNLINISTKEYL